MCHQKLDSSVSKMSTLMSANGPLLEKFGLDTIHTDVLSIESCRSTELPAIHLDVEPSGLCLSSIFPIVTETSEESNYNQKTPCNVESPSATFVSTDWTRKRRTAAF
jgi:hypothetical protein